MIVTLTTVILVPTDASDICIDLPTLVLTAVVVFLICTLVKFFVEVVVVKKVLFGAFDVKVGLGVGVTLGPGIAVAVGLGDGVGVTTGVGVGVGVGLGVGVGVGVGVTIALTGVG